MTGISCIMAGVIGSGAGLLDEQTVTSGAVTAGANPYTYTYGYQTGALGSIADGTSDIYAGAAIDELLFYEEGYSDPPIGYTSRIVRLKINGTLSNSGWEFIKIGSTTYARGDATFLASGGKTSWTWPLPISDPYTSGAPGPFASTTDVEFS